MTILVSEFKKIEIDDKTEYSTAYFNLKGEKMLTRVILTISLTKFILRLYQTCNKFLEKIRVGLFIS